MRILGETAMNISSGRNNMGNKKIRTFVAIPLPEHVLSRLAGLARDLKKHPLRLKWSRIENIHLTLKFLGDILTEDVDPVCEAVSSACRQCDPFTLSVKGVGVFPNIRRPRVLWTGISGQTDRLTALQRSIDSGLGDLGYPEDDRRFTGHLTLGRFKGHQDPDALIDIMKAFADTGSDEFFTDSIGVYKSDLKPSGPIYTNLATIRLAG